MGDEQDPFIANIVDTGIFWGLGKPPRDGFETLRSAVIEAGVTLYLPRPIYAELGGDPDADAYPSGSDYVDPGIEEGWITVADPIGDNPVVQRVVSNASHIIKEMAVHPKTTCVEEDTTIIALAAQKFVRNESIYVNIHTNDKAVAKAGVIALSEEGFYDVEVNFIPPQEAERCFSTSAQFKHSRA